MKTSKISVKPVSFLQLKKMFKKRIFAIPEIQREFVWTKSKILALLDSIKKHYPIGSFLICRVPRNKVREVRENASIPKFDTKNKECYLVIDGQQRLSVLYSVLSGNKIVSKNNQREIDFTKIFLLKGAHEGPDFAFYINHWDDEPSLTKTLNNTLENNIKKSYKKHVKICKKSFDNYEFPFIFINGYDEENMREAFIRLNKGGTSLSAEDKIFAEAYHKDSDLRRDCMQLTHDLKKGFANIDKKTIIKTIAALIYDLKKDFVSDQTQIAMAKELRKTRSFTHKEYLTRKKKVFRSIQGACDYLDARVRHASYLPYDTMVTVLAVYFYYSNNRNPLPQHIEQINRWFWLTGFSRRYTGQDYRLNQINDAKEMRRLAENKTEKIKIEANPISMRSIFNQRYDKAGALRNAYFCYLLSKRPMSFVNGEEVQVYEMSSLLNKKNDHHVFPKKRLAGYVKKDKINCILNICFLTAQNNFQISAELPWKYLKEYSRQKKFSQILKSQAMNIADLKVLLKAGNRVAKFNQFIELRKNLIKKDLIKLVGNKYVTE